MKPSTLAIGFRSGTLEVIAEGEPRINKNGKKAGLQYLCKCDCGNTKHYYATNLIRGISHTCHKCSVRDRYNDSLQIGQIFGDLTVINDTPIIKKYGSTDGARRFYICRCKCGNESNYYDSRLRKGYNKECKSCAYKKRPQSLIRRTGFERLFDLCIYGRSRRNGRVLEVTLTMDEFIQISSQDCTYCGEPPRKRKYADTIYANGIDRKNPDLGYTYENSTACCARCNFMKGTLQVDEFINQINKIYVKQTRGLTV